jgi:hypothetical protein
MAEIFGEDTVDTVPEELGGQIPHQPTRVFLTTAGLPDQADTQGWFHRVEELSEAVEDKGWPELVDKFPEVAQAYHFDEWICPGDIPYDSVHIDATTGLVYAVSEEDGEPYPLHTGIEAFAYLLCVTEAERPFYSGTPDGSPHEESLMRRTENLLARLYGKPYEQVGETPEDRIRATIERTDPMALARPTSIWNTVLGYIKQGVD